MLSDPQFHGPEEALRWSSESTRFIIETTMWSDVLTSVTMWQVPRLIETYREIFNTAFIRGPLGDGVGGAVGGEKTATSTLLVMGCENKVVLVFTEISNPSSCSASRISRRGTSRQACS